MKTKLIVSALLVALITGVAAAADPVKPKVVILNQKEAGVFKVIYEGAQIGKVNLRIADQQGTVLFKETISNVDGFIRPVNLKSLEAGEYTIEVSDSFGKFAQKVSNSVAKQESVFHLAKIAGDNKYLLSVAKGEDINVKIFDGQNNLVHNEDLVVNGNLGLVYNLKGVAGIPTFEVKDNTGNVKVIRF
jgi:6-phosphogluconolactonase (cycloisomerase 2 family)